MRALLAAFGDKQFLALIDRQDQRRRSRLRVVAGKGGAGAVGEGVQQGPQRCRAAGNRFPDIGARFGRSLGRESGLQRAEQSDFAVDRRPLRPDDRQNEIIAVVAHQPWQQAGAQERRFAGARRAEQHKEARGRSVVHAANTIERRRWSALRARKRCRRRQPPAAAGRDRAGGWDRCPAARQRTGGRVPRARARSVAASGLPWRR